MGQILNSGLLPREMENLTYIGFRDDVFYFDDSVKSTLDNANYAFCMDNGIKIYKRKSGNVLTKPNRHDKVSGWVEIKPEWPYYHIIYEELAKKMMHEVRFLNVQLKNAQAQIRNAQAGVV